MRKEFYIQSYWCACYLHCQNVPPIKIELSPRGKRLFFYDNNENIQELIRKFYDDPELQCFVRSCVELKSEMFRTSDRERELRRNVRRAGSDELDASDDRAI